MSLSLATPRSQDSAARPDVRSLVASLHALRRQTSGEGLDAAAWRQFCELMRALCRADAAVVVVQEAPATGPWRVAGCAPDSAAALSAAALEAAPELARQTREKGFAAIPTRGEAGALAIRLAVRIEGAGASLLLLELPAEERAHLNELALRALLACDLPAAQSTPAPAKSAPAQSADDWLALLDLAAQVMQEKRFATAALALVNGLAVHLGIGHVALGWLRHDHMRVQAVSHLDNFDRKTDSIQKLEAAMDEACTLDREVCWPAAGEGAEAHPAHADLRPALGGESWVSLPLCGAEGVITGMVTLAFNEAEPPRARIEHLRVLLEFLQPWLNQRHLDERGVVARSLDALKRRVEIIAGPGHALAKTCAIVAAVLLLVALFGTWPYRVEATAQLSTDSTRLLSAQIDGRIEEVFATSGDTVRAGAVLSVLDVREIRQQEAESLADIKRYTTEADKARATGNLAEMEISTARAAQAEARLSRVRYYLEQSRTQAPFDGVVVEGERKDLVGAPVKKGDRLFRIARIEGLYATLMLPERDIRFIEPGATGELQLLSRPDLKIPFRLANLIPVAQVKGQEGNHFMIRAELLSPAEPWWRPGMSGMARIEAGDRNIGWILTHRAIDALRMMLWW